MPAPVLTKDEADELRRRAHEIVTSFPRLTPEQKDELGRLLSPAAA